MATYTEIAPHSQDVSSSVVMDHGSISFGRFAAEPLAWEKWSVFQQNRCQEELEMYKWNGLVAQKKAYFEEYFKGVRAFKGLQSEHQVGACADDQSDSVQLEIGNVGNDKSKEEMSRPGTVDEAGQANKEFLSHCNAYSDNSTLSDVDREKSLHEAAVSATLPVARSSGAAKLDRHVSDPVKRNANERKKLAPVPKAKGNAASSRNTLKLDCTSPKDAVKASVKIKSLPLSQINGKRDNILLPSKTNSPVACGKYSSQVSSRKKFTEVHSIAAVQRPSSTRIRMVPSSPSGDSINANMSGKSLRDSLRRSQNFHARAVQNPSQEKPITNGLKDKALEKRTCPGVTRKPSEFMCQQMRPKVCQSENQRPNSMLPNIARNRLIRDTEAGCGRTNYKKERKEKEGIHSTWRRDSKAPYNLASSIQKNLKPVHKGKEEISTAHKSDLKPASIVEKNAKPCYKTAESRSGS